MTRRRLPRWAELRPFLRVQSLGSSPSARRLAGAATIADLRNIARRHRPRAVFDYVDGAAETETSLRRSREAFGRIEFSPRVLRDVSAVDTTTIILGRRSTLPLIFAPTGFTRLMHQEGEPAVARVAARLGIPYVLSTMGTTSPEDVAAATPNGANWFQLYLWRDRDASVALVERARAAGFGALMLTVDTPVAGARLRDSRNGFSIPPALTLKTLADITLHPGWWFDVLSTEPLRFASLDAWQGTVAELIDQMFDPALNLKDLAWLRGIWPAPLIVKGIQTVEDAKAVVEVGVDAIVVSNHGGRQLDRSPVPLEQLPAILEAVDGRAEVYLDGGIMNGGDIVAAVGMGADACLVGRAYLYGLMAGGEAGVQRAAELIERDIVRTMQLLGVRDLAGLRDGRVTLRDH
ncbi:MAG: alpha-hydroxy acid oxidase [Chloroflexota bacterium]